MASGTEQKENQKEEDQKKREKRPKVVTIKEIPDEIKQEVFLIGKS